METISIAISAAICLQICRKRGAPFTDPTITGKFWDPQQASLPETPFWRIQAPHRPDRAAASRSPSIAIDKAVLLNWQWRVGRNYMTKIESSKVAHQFVGGCLSTPLGQTMQRSDVPRRRAWDPVAGPASRPPERVKHPARFLWRQAGVAAYRGVAKPKTTTSSRQPLDISREFCEVVSDVARFRKVSQHPIICTYSPRHGNTAVIVFKITTFGSVCSTRVSPGKTCRYASGIAQCDGMAEIRAHHFEKRNPNLVSTLERSFSTRLNTLRLSRTFVGAIAVRYISEHLGLRNDDNQNGATVTVGLGE